MTRKQLGRAVAERQGMTYKDSDWAVKAVFDTLKTMLAEEDKVVVHGFGTFRKVEQGPKTFRHPATGEIRTRPPFKAVRFTAAEVLIDEINNQ